MPDNAGYVGGLYVPLETEGFPSDIPDPVVNGLADYLAFWIRYGIEYKIQEPNTTVPDPLPDGNVFPYEPGDNWVRNLNETTNEIAVPALYLWWNGESKVERRTLTQWMRVRRLRCFYAATEVTIPVGTVTFSGLPNAIDAILHMASVHGFHTDYGYQGAALGTPIAKSLNLIGWTYDGGKADMAAALPEVSTRAGGPGGGVVVQGYPVLFGNFTVMENVDQPGTGASDGPVDIPFTITTNDPADVNGPLDIMTRYLPSPSENEGQDVA